MRKEEKCGAWARLFRVTKIRNYGDVSKGSSGGLVDGRGYDASSSVCAGECRSRRRYRASLAQVRKKGWDRRRENRLPGLSGGGLVAQVTRVKPYLRQERWLLAPRWEDICATYFVRGLRRGQISVEMGFQGRDSAALALAASRCPPGGALQRYDSQPPG